MTSTIEVPEAARPRPSRTGFWWGLLAGLIGTGVGAVLAFTAIRRSTISTAALGLVFELPIVALLWGIQGWLIGFCAGYLVAARRAGWGWKRGGTAVAGLVLLAVAGRLTIEVVTQLAVGAQVRQIEKMDEPQLRAVLDSRLLGRNLFVLAAVAGNERASAGTLRQIASRPDPQLHQKLGSIYDVMGTNTHGLAVMRLVARNPHVDWETLEILSRSPDPYVLGDVAMNPKLSDEALGRLLLREDVLAVLKRDPDERVSGSAARNPKTLPGVIDLLNTDPDER